jgi:hypothetical protein
MFAVSLYKPQVKLAEGFLFVFVPERPDDKKG